MDTPSPNSETFFSFFKRSSPLIKLRLILLFALGLGVVSLSLTSIGLLLFKSGDHATRDTASDAHEEESHHSSDAHSGSGHTKEAAGHGSGHASGHANVHASDHGSPDGHGHANGHLYEFQNISIGLTDQTKTFSAYAQFSLVLECKDEAALKWMKMNRARLLSIIYESAAGFKMEDFKKPAGLAAFKEAILKYIEVEYSGHPLVGISIRDWLLN